MVSIKALTLSVFGFAAFSNAVVIEMFADQNCGQSVGTRNVYDNTCAYTQGFQSVKILTYGGSAQLLHLYSRQACAGVQTNSLAADGSCGYQTGKCFPAYNGSGGTNAVASYSGFGCN